MRPIKLILTFLFLLFLAVPSACVGTNNTSNTTPPATYSSYELAYKLLAEYPDNFWCDPDFYPIAREGQEQTNALEQFAAIKANNVEFAAILEQTGFAEQSVYSDEQKLTIYREHKKLTFAVTMTPEGDHYLFIIRTGRDQGKSIEGIISSDGTIKVLKETDSFNTCPICLTRGILIAAPMGEIPVENARPGMMVWSVDNYNQRIAVPILKTSQTPVPQNFTVIRITLLDGRSVSASPGHPSAAYRPLGDYRVGDFVDGSAVIRIDYPIYKGEATFDLLPGGLTGLYYANGIRLSSTLPPE
jgi:hypothetical protein